MKRGTRCTRSGFTLIELLIVVLVLGVLTSIGLPAYISSAYSTRQNTANANARAIAAAVQVRSIARGSYDTTITDYSADMGGVVPVNPCTGGSSDYTITATSTAATVTAMVGTSCGSWTPTPFTVHR